mmetsp:Transcript_126574/g.269975  ORF Transcript_126574/g.269975 Transcript_126574/m.269975 type:complete len:771 (-) Transcript_126574:151-2463(-)
MTVTAGVPLQGPAVIFDLVANFLEKCQFRAAANAIRVQCSEKELVVEAEFVKNLRGLADGSALALAEIEAGMGEIQPKQGSQEVVLEKLVDGLLRKLMASGHSLSDEKLNSSIDGVLSSDVFSKLNVMDGALEKQLVACSDLLGVNDIDVHRYWEQIQRESNADGQAPKADQAAAGGCVVGGAAPQPEAAAQPPLPASFYKARRSRGAREGEEEWDEDDEYHDDDDPGYRIREIYEVELLAELSNKMQPSAAGGEQSGPVADELATASLTSAPPGEAGAGSPGGLPPSPLSAGWPGGDRSMIQETQGGSEGVPSPSLEATALGGAGAASAEAPGEANEIRATSPTFGGDGAVAVAEAQGAPAAAAAPDAGAVLAETPGAAEAEEQRERRDRRRRAPKAGTRYAASGDSFYPVELDGVIYDSFGLRVVFERDKTGFEESKEFPIRMNTVVAARYQILEYLGSAAFSRAVQCLDLENNKMVCMKIIKNDKDFFDQSLDEIKLLKYINVNGDVDENCVLRLYDYFYHKEHLIIVTELLRDNLYEFSKFNRESGDEPYFTLGRLQKISKQVLTALDYVHSLRLIHCDLKPENILIRSYSRCEVKVIDFGSSCFVDDHLSSYVQSRSYRAPEVMLGLPYDQKIDIWSLGCILAELWTGYVLFQNDSVQSLLARILGIIGDFPYHLMTRGKYVPQYFTQDGQLYQEIDGPACPERGRRLHLLVPKKTSLRQRMRTDSEEFLDFLGGMLQLDPTLRPTAAEALEHPFLTRCKYVDGF